MKHGGGLLFEGTEVDALEEWAEEFGNHLFGEVVAPGCEAGVGGHVVVVVVVGGVVVVGEELGDGCEEYVEYEW